MTHRPAIVLGLGTLATAFVLLGPARAQAQISDTTPPHLVTIGFTPNSIDVTSAAKTVTVTATITDDLSGTSGVYVQFTSPSGRQVQPLNYAFLPRISGSGLNGVYQSAVTIPTLSESGIWKLSMSLSDAVSNSVFLGPANLTSLGLPTDLIVVSTPDTEAPKITNFSLTPSSINVSAGAQNVTLRMTLTDNLSGVDFSPARFLEFRVTFRSPSGQEQYLTRNDFTLTSGTLLNGTWSATRSIPH